MVDSLPLRIFLATPGDLTQEREVVRAAVREHNARQTSESDVPYEVVGWERVRGTARRPQEAINELIGECHFLISILKERWGSEPGSPWGYTSGTEEELFTGLLELGQAEQPMRDVWVVFMEHPNPAKEIIDLQRQMSQHHSMMYEVAEDARDLKDKLTERLKAWEASAGQKNPMLVDLLPSSGKEVLRAANLRIHGEKLVDLGQPAAGRSALQEAAVLGGPLEQLAYAKFLGRHGELEEAYAVTQTAIDYFATQISSLYTPLAAEAFAAQAAILRRQGRDLDAIGRLEQALSLLSSDEGYTQRVRCRILDNLGIAQQKVKDLDSARQSFEAALDSRRESGVALDECQSLVNLARLEVAAGHLEVAAEHAESVGNILRGTPPSALHANAQVLMAQIRLRQGLPKEGIQYAERGVALNRQMGNRHGEAISLLVLAECCRATGDDDEAMKYAQASLELNRSMESDFGVQRATRFIENQSRE